MTESLESRQSALINAMRFPLIVLVVLAHSLSFGNVDVFSGNAGWNAYHFTSELLSHNLARLAVCWFYAISGYFFFYNLKDGNFNFKWVTGKWKKRVSGLLVPYLIWNLLLVLITFLKEWIFTKAGLGNNGEWEFLQQSGPIYWLWKGPANFPLYFMRDLMIMSLVAPLWYLFVKWAKWPSLALLILVYVSPLNPSLPAMRAIFFFGLGAWMGIWKINMLQICRKFRLSSAILALLLVVIATVFNSSKYHEWLLRAFYPFGMMTFMNICDRMASNEKRFNKLISLSGTVFFIYAAHEIFILGWTKGLCLRIFGDGLAGSWISYFLVPVIVLAVCLLLYNIINRIMPRTLAFACGGRAKKK